VILAVNVGNALISVGLYDKDGKQLAKTLFSSLAHTTSHEYSYKLRCFLRFEGWEPTQIEGAILSPVNPLSSAAVAEAIRLTCGKTPLQVGPGIRTGLDILLKDPASLGADVVAMSVAALHKHKPPLIIVVIGAIAMVFFVTNERGQYVGGAIAPSPRLSLTALSDSAASLPAMAIEAPTRLIGTDTREALNSGIVFGAAAMIKGMVEMMVDKIALPPHNSNVKIVVTGSVAPAIVPYIGIEVEQDADLLLDGLNLLYNRNRRK